jgi:hypothetical protein
MSSGPAEHARTAVGLGDVNVSLKVNVDQADVTCELLYRGNKVLVTFPLEGGQARAVQVPGMSHRAASKIVRGDLNPVRRRRLYHPGLRPVPRGPGLGD